MGRLLCPKPRFFNYVQGISYFSGKLGQAGLEPQAGNQPVPQAGNDCHSAEAAGKAAGPVYIAGFWPCVAPAGSVPTLCSGGCLLAL